MKNAISVVTKIQFVLSLCVLHIVLFLFQNCVEIEGSKGFRVSASLSSGTGSGEGYEGKLTNHYYRMIPNHKCESIPAAYGELKLNSLNEVSLKRNPAEQCSQNFVPVSYNCIAATH